MARLAVIAILFQAAHFVEEVATGFPRRFPAQLGLVPWSYAFFVGFNVFWLAIWGLSSWGLRGRFRSAAAALWFLGISGLANGLAHPALSARVGGYFPGLLTSPFVGVAGFVLLQRLASVTSRHGPAPRAD